MRLLRSLRRELTLLAVLFIVVAVMSVLSPYFLDAENLLGQTKHQAEIGIIACGMTLIIMTGGIDLSVGSILGLCGIVLGYSWQAWGAGPAIAMAVMVGVACGALNGFLVTRWRFPALVVTLATMALFRGVAMIISRAQPVSDFPTWFFWLGQEHFGLVPVQLVFWIAIVAVTVIVTTRTPAGRYLTAVGDNERAARFAGVSASWVKFWAYAATGLLCSIAAIIYTSRVATARSDSGQFFELTAITAVVLGGTSITGGRGTVLGTFLGVLILGVISNGLKLAGVSSDWQEIVTGGILIVTAIINQYATGRAGK